MFFSGTWGLGGGGWNWLLACLCYERGDDWGASEEGVGTKVAAKAPINTLIAAWQEQAVPVKDTLGHWRGGVGESFPRADVRLWSPSEKMV